MAKLCSEPPELSEKAKPQCPVFGSCGGCAYQDLPYDQELRIKETELKTLFQKELGLPDEVFEGIVPSPAPYFYRNRLDVGIYRRRNGEVLMGFRHEGTHRTVPIDSCSIACREISDFLPELKERARDRLPRHYRTANLVVKTGDDGRVFWGGIGRKSLVMPESDYLWTKVGGKKIFYSLDTFFQANLSILSHLVEKIKALVELDSRTLFLDLYSGVGLFGISLAPWVHKVIMVEESTTSVRMAAFNARFHSLEDKIEIREDKVENVLFHVLQSATSLKKIALIDPPRRGLSDVVLNEITRAAGRDQLGELSHGLSALLYLSCSCESLIRDLSVLVGKGWQVRRVIPFDFFPKTRHLETLALLYPAPAALFEDRGTVR